MKNFAISAKNRPLIKQLPRANSNQFPNRDNRLFHRHSLQFTSLQIDQISSSISISNRCNKIQVIHSKIVMLIAKAVQQVGQARTFLKATQTTNKGKTTTEGSRPMREVTLLRVGERQHNPCLRLRDNSNSNNMINSRDNLNHTMPQQMHLLYPYKVVQRLAKNMDWQTKTTNSIASWMLCSSLYGSFQHWEQECSLFVRCAQAAQQSSKSSSMLCRRFSQGLSRTSSSMRSWPDNQFYWPTAMTSELSCSS